jgi:hypothetical protein
VKNMVNTLISEIASQIVQNESQATITGGRLTADTYPGQSVVFVSGKWVKIASGTAAHNLLTIGVVVYRRRINNAGAVPTIDAVIDIDAEPALDMAEICTSGFCAAFIDDPTETLYPMQAMMASSTAGNLVKLAKGATGATSGLALISLAVATLASKVVSGDTKAFIGIGDFYGKIM